MKKRLLRYMVLTAIVVAAGWNISKNRKEAKFSGLALENVEALAGGEGGSLPPLQCWKTISTFSGENALTHVTYCGGCKAMTARSWSDESTCNN